MGQTENPLVSIGVPTFNRPDSLKKVINSLLNQTYQNIEIIISDNGSDHPDVPKVVENILATDKENKVRYYRQAENLGAAYNFKYVLDDAKGDYFMWNADDDIRSPDFIEVNTQFLENNLVYAGSTSPNTLVSDFNEEVSEYVRFGLEGDKYERFQTFFDHALVSHGIFYSQFRTEIIRQCPFLGKHFIATDWAISLFVLSHGPIARLDSGYILNLRGGVSESESHFKNYRHNLIDDVNPMYRFYNETKGLYRSFKFSDRLRFFFRIMKFNHIYYAGLFNQLRRLLSRFRRF